MDRIEEQSTTVRTVTIPLYNLGCGGGRVTLVERILARESGVIQVYANPATSEACLQYDPALTNRTVLNDVIRQLGYGLPNSHS